MLYNKYKKYKEWVIERLLAGVAMVSIVIIAFIIITIFGTGLPLIAEVGLFDFLFGMDWRPGHEIFGIFPMMIGTLLVTLLSMLISVPIGILTAVFLAEVAPDIIRNILRPAIELLAGIPSVIYGFVGLIVLVPLIRTHL